MSSSQLWPYASPVNHESVSAIIRRRSTNKTDVREVALQGLDLSKIKRVLDLGCGFGFIEEVLADRVAPDAVFVGVDALKSNEPAFRGKVTRSGHRGGFVCRELDARLPWPTDRFDLVVCCYALYFFVEIIPEVARVLAPDGVFLAITHYEKSIAGQLPAAGFEDAASRLLDLTRRFSAENGRDLLGPHFGEINRIDYENSLQFTADDVEELLRFLRFKLPFLVPDAKPGDDLPDSIARFAQVVMRRTGGLTVEKNDAIFQCRRPR
ncbi:MAG: class I SAM-dependent methyltransferase [Phycisphaerae bacterium]|jgi:SAM-dependent methyltransferase